MRVAGVLIPRLPLALALRARPDLRGQPVVVTTADPSPARATTGAVVAACSSQAARAGVRPGMPVPEALARCPEAILQTLPAAALAQATAHLHRVLARCSPLVEGAGPGSAFVGLDGLAGVGDPATELALAERLQQAVQAALGLVTRVGVADSRVAARAAAWLAPPALPGRTPVLPLPAFAASAVRRAVVAPGAAATAAFLAPLPLHWLTLPAAMRARLAWLGIRTVGALAALPKGALLAQCGPAGGRAWDLAHGLDPDGPIPPHRTPPVRHAALAFPRPVSTRDALHAGLRALLTRLLPASTGTGHAARGATLTATLATGRQQRWTVTCPAPTGDPEHLERLLVARLDGVTLPAPVTALALTLHGLCREVGVQARLFPIAPAPRWQQLAATLAQLHARFGRPVLHHIVEVEPWSRIPERRYALAPVETGQSGRTSRSSARSTALAPSR